MKQLFITVLLLSTLSSFGQQTSPYSRFGLGQLTKSEQAHLQSMGGSSTAYVDSVQTNLSNPATLGEKQFASIDIGLNLGYHNLRDQAVSTNVTNGGVSYLGYSFPVNAKKTWGMAFGAKPYSNKKYEVTQGIINNTYFKQYDGEGNTYNLFWQNGVTIADHLKLGLDAGLFFGTLKDGTYNNYVNTLANSSGQRVQQKLRGFTFKLGAQYTADLNDEIDLTIGSTYGLASDINNDVITDNFLYKFTFETLENGQLNVLGRSEFNNNEVTEKKTTTIPAELGVGAFLRKSEKWSFGLDGKIGFWEDFTPVNDGVSNDITYQNSMSLRAGGSFIPKYRNPSRKYESFEYRYGAHYTKDFLQVNGQEINDYGVTLGASFPINQNRPGSRIRRIPSNIDVAVDIGQKGTLNENLVQDAYIKGTIGFNLNDIWFQKERYD